MGIDRIVVHNHGFDKRIDGKIGALVQQMIEPTEVVFGHKPGLVAGPFSAFATPKQKADP
jgi:hypothetical protein